MNAHDRILSHIVLFDEQLRIGPIVDKQTPHSGQFKMGVLVYMCTEDLIKPIDVQGECCYNRGYPCSVQAGRDEIITFFSDKRPPPVNHTPEVSIGRCWGCGPLI